METKNLFEIHSFRANEYEAEQNFRETCSWYESKFSISDQKSSQAYQKYINSYHKVKSLYQIPRYSNNATHLIIYDTESERKEVKTLKTPKTLNTTDCITLLPNGELFSFCRIQKQRETLIIDNNYKGRLLPSGLPLSSSSAIYFNANIYCFGGSDKNSKPTSFSRKFDLNENRWINLTPMPKAETHCRSVIVNDNIFICGYNKNLLLYSVGIDSFSIIPYEFLDDRKKMLVNAERLYLIECLGFIYESDAENEFVWKRISISIIMDFPYQIYCLYNKGEIYISTEPIGEGERYYKFSLLYKVDNETQTI